MADSVFDDFVQAVEVQLADSTVLFAGSKIEKDRGKRDQARRVSFVRIAGKVTMRQSPKPGAEPKLMTRFNDEQRIVMTVAAEDEQTTFQLFSNLLNAIFEIMGPNAFNTENEYEWANDDSKGGGNVVRQPILNFELYIRLRMQPPALLSQVIEQTIINTELEAPIQ